MLLVVVLLSQLKYLKVYMLPLSWNIKMIELLHEHFCTFEEQIILIIKTTRLTKGNMILVC